MKVRANIKRRATETQDPTQVILGRKLGGISKVSVINWPALHHMRRNISLQRQANQQLPNPATQNSTLNINVLAPMNSFLHSTVDKVMLIDVSALEQTKVSSYFHSHKIGLVMEALRFVHRYFFRYTLFIHKTKERILPCINVLLSNKSEGTYTRLFREVE